MKVFPALNSLCFDTVNFSGYCSPHIIQLHLVKDMHVSASQCYFKHLVCGLVFEVHNFQTTEPSADRPCFE